MMNSKTFVHTPKVYQNILLPFFIQQPLTYLLFRARHTARWWGYSDKPIQKKGLIELTDDWGGQKANDCVTKYIILS